MPILQHSTTLAARLLLAAIFIFEGWMKLNNYNGIVGYMEENGVSGRLLPLVIATELGGGLLVAFGLFARLAGLALAGFCVLTAFFFHRNFSDSDQMIHFMKNLSMAGGFLLLTAFGPGLWSLDAWRSR